MHEPKETRLLLDWTLDAKHAPFKAGMLAGCYQERGIALSLREPAKKSSLALELLHRGEVELAINYPHNILLMQDVCPGIVSVGSLVQSNPEGLLSLSSTGIRSPEDLIGKRVGVGPSPVSRAQFRLFLAGNGVPQERVEEVTVGFEGEELLLAGEIDALDAVSYAIPRTTQKGFAVDFLAYTRYGLPDSPFLVFAARKDWVAAEAGLLRGFFEATREGIGIVESWKEADWDEYVRDLPGRKSGRQEMEIWKLTLELMKPGRLFRQERSGIEGLAGILEREGLLAPGYDLPELFPAFEYS